MTIGRLSSIKAPALFYLFLPLSGKAKRKKGMASGNGPPPNSAFVTPLEYSVHEFIVDRLVTWHVTMNSSIEYFKEIAHVERAKGRGLRKAAAVLAPKQIANAAQGAAAAAQGPSMMGMLSSTSMSFYASQSSTSTSRSSSPPPGTEAEKPPDRGNFWLVPLQAAALKGENEANGLLSYIEGQVVPRLEELKAFYKQHRDSIRNRLQASYQQLWLCHDRLTSAIENYSNINKTPTTGGESPDPWLSEIQLRGRIDGWVKNLGPHYQCLQQCLVDLRELDGSMTQRAGAIMNEYFIVASKTAAMQSEQLAEMSSVMQMVDAGQEWGGALARARLDYNWALSVPPVDAFSLSVFSTLPQAAASGQEVRTHNVKKAGFLMKQGGGFTRSWSSYFCILTDSNYFHGYRTANLAGGEQFRIPSTTMQLHKRALDEMSEQMLQGLFGERPEILAEPAVSISLNPIVFKPERNRQFTLSVSQEGGLFFGKSEKKITFRSWTEEDISEWILLIEESIAEAQREHAKQQMMQHVQRNSVNDGQSTQNTVTSPYAHDRGYPETEHHNHDYQHQYYDDYAHNEPTPTSPYAATNPSAFDNPWND